jgi:pimeloyl-ACP methyl ester carboxylesterase
LGELLSHSVKQVRTLASQGYDAYLKVAPPSDRVVMLRPEMKAAFLYDLVTAAEGGLRAFVADLVLFGRQWGFSLKDIRVPVRFWHGDADGIVPLAHGEFQASLVPGAALVITHGGGHFAGFLIAGDVFDWIGAVWPERAHAPQRTAGQPH